VLDEVAEMRHALDSSLPSGLTQYRIGARQRLIIHPREHQHLAGRHPNHVGEAMVGHRQNTNTAAALRSQIAQHLPSSAFGCLAELQAAGDGKEDHPAGSPS